MNSDTTSLQRADALPSGRFVLRIDPLLHAALRDRAREAGSSLNEYCARALALPATDFQGPAAEAVSRAVAMVGDALLGVAVFGSWARQESGRGSDVDLLIIVEEGFAIGRGLYRSWDESPVFWEGHSVEPHFVHLPPPGARLSGMWAEVAIDGVVLFERGLELSRRLVEFRQIIASGRLLRRRSHGQPYWVEVA